MTEGGAWRRVVGFVVDNVLVVFLALVVIVGAGVYVSPFDWDLGVSRSPVPVDAIPDIGENQQIVFTKWQGRSPKDIESQVTYPLTAALLGIPGVRTARSSSMFGFSSIYLIFEDGVDFYWARSRVLEKLASLSPGMLPEDAVPQLGPDATALGQVFWYTLEGRAADGRVVGGWDLHELRSLQDWTVRYALQSVPGVSEVASVGGYVQEYQVNVDPQAMQVHGVSLQQVTDAVRASNLDVGARTMEINRVEYLIRGLGFIKRIEDLEETVVRVRDHTPVRVRDIAHVSLGPAERRGVLDDGGAEAVGGVVVARYGANPAEVIEGVKAKIAELERGLPRRTLEDGTESRVRIVPFYDRALLIQETLGTLSGALYQQILITILVVLLLFHGLRSSTAIVAGLPLVVLMTFVAMKAFGVEANIMALAGIAIAIGTAVDLGIVVVENAVARLDAADASGSRTERIISSVVEVAPAITTSVLTTVVSFLPVFALDGAEGKLFTPLAYTKTFAMVAAMMVAILILPAALRVLYPRKGVPQGAATRSARLGGWLIAGGALVLLAEDWQPLGGHRWWVWNFVAVTLVILVAVGLFGLLRRVYRAALSWSLQHRASTLLFAAAVVAGGAVSASRLERAFMPPFDEGAYLYMPTTMAHASLGQSKEMLSRLDAAIAAIPEVERAVGKLGRVDSALDPAPVSMFEVVVNYRSEFGRNESGERVRQWRSHIRGPDDIWAEIVEAARMPGLTSAPPLMPINTRIVMLQSGMRSPMGIKVQGTDLDTIARFGLALEEILKEVPEVRAETVLADRVVGKPYIEIDIDRPSIGRYGLTIGQVQSSIEVALGGRSVTRTVEGRERYAVRVRYMREERGSLEALARVLISTPEGEQIPLQQVASVRYVKGPQVIKSEDTFLTSYVLFDRVEEHSEMAVVRAAESAIQRAVSNGRLKVPAGVRYRFAGTYENQLRSEARLRLLVPLAVVLVFLLLYLQFRRVGTTLIIFSGAAVALAGGFLLLGVCGSLSSLDGSGVMAVFGELLNIRGVELSVAVWVGFIALLGIATDAGVVMATYLAQRFAAEPPSTVEEVRARALEGGLRRVRPCLMTTATTALAMLPIVLSQGRGADVMAPMALPVLGGMMTLLLTLFTVPVLYAWREEVVLRHRLSRAGETASS